MKAATSFCVSLMILVSCQGEKENEALVAKHQEQRETIQTLEAEIREVRVAIEDVRTPDDFPDLKKLKTELKEAVKKRETLEKEMSDLNVKKKKVEEDLVSYKKNYPIR